MADKERVDHFTFLRDHFDGKDNIIMDQVFSALVAEYPDNSYDMLVLVSRTFMSYLAAGEVIKNGKKDVR